MFVGACQTAQNNEPELGATASALYSATAEAGAQINAVPSVDPYAEIATPIPAAEVEFTSGGLGMTQADWEATNGTPGADSTGGYFFYKDNTFTVIYQDGSIDRLEQALGETGMTVDEAREASKALIPQDSELVKTYTSFDGRTVDLYKSEALIQQFPSSMRVGYENVSYWVGGEPGNFTVTYGANNDRVTKIILATGNNP
jgi:hypothetical protein